MCAVRVFIVATVYLLTLTWKHTSVYAAYQYFLSGTNGDYKYGYRTNNGIVARQEADSANQVSGHYYYRDDLGNFGLKYTAGVQGYRPENLKPNDLTLGYPCTQGVYQTIQPPRNIANSNQQGLTANYNPGSRQPNYPINCQWNYQTQPPANTLRQTPYLTPYYLISLPYSNNVDNLYFNLTFDDGNYRNERPADSSGNIRGYFQYEDDVGKHDLSYILNDKTGFQTTGGSLASNFPENLPPSIHRPLFISSGQKPGNFNSQNDRTNQDGLSGQLEYPFKAQRPNVHDGRPTAYEGRHEKPTTFDERYNIHDETTITYDGRPRPNDEGSEDDIVFLVGKTTEMPAEVT